MKKSNYFVIAFLLLLGTIGLLVGTFKFDGSERIAIIAICAVLFLIFIFILLYALSLAIGKKYKAKITSINRIATKVRTGDSVNDIRTRVYYECKYSMEINGKILNSYIKINNYDLILIEYLKPDVEIELNKFLFVITLDKVKLKKQILEEKAETEKYKQLLEKENGMLARLHKKYLFMEIIAAILVSLVIFGFIIK